IAAFFDVGRERGAAQRGPHLFRDGVKQAFKNFQLNRITHARTSVKHSSRGTASRVRSRVEGLLKVDLHFVLPVGHHFERSSLPEIRLDHVRIEPLQVPAVFNGHHSVFSGMAPARVNVPSLSLWSRRTSMALFPGSLGTRTTMAPANGFPPRRTVPVTWPMPWPIITARFTVPVRLISTVRPEAFAPDAEMARMNSPLPFVNASSYVPGGIGCLNRTSPLSGTSSL